MLHHISIINLFLIIIFHVCNARGMELAKPSGSNAMHLKIKNKLKTNPLAVLEEITRIKAVFDRYKGKTDIPLLSFIKKHETLNPLFFTSECTNNDCIYSRNNNPVLRKIYEERATTLLLKQIELHAKQRTIHYVSAGAGGLFPDIVILTRVLEEEPNTHLHIHFIDPLYSTYLSAKKSRDINKDEAIKIASPAFNQQVMFRQCMQWLTTMFPKARIIISVYGSIQNYIDYATQENTEYPDLVIAVDLGNESIENNQQSAHDFAILAALSSYHKASCDHLFLYDRFQKGYFTRIFLSPIQSSSYCASEVIKADNTKTPCIYLYYEAVTHLIEKNTRKK